MTARQQSLSAKIPRYAALFFPKDKSTGIIPTTNIQAESYQTKDTVTCMWDGEIVTAEIIEMSNSYATLNGAIDEFELPAESDETPEVSTTNRPKTKPAKKTSKKQTAKPAAVTVASGPAANGPVPDTTPEAAYMYETDPYVDQVTELADEGLSVKSVQTEGVETVNNWTQTPPDSRIELFEILLKKMEQLEQNCDIVSLEKRLTDRIDLLDLKLSQQPRQSAISVVSDVYDFTDDVSSQPMTPSRNRLMNMPSTPQTPRQKCAVSEMGFWKLTPSEVLGKDTESVVNLASTRSMLHDPRLDSSVLDTVKCDSMNQRTLFAKNLMNAYCTLDELYNKNVNGRVSHGNVKGKINTVKIDEIRCEVFKYFPCLVSEEKKCWSECVKVMDKANLYAFSVINRKFDISQITGYLM